MSRKKAQVGLRARTVDHLNAWLIMLPSLVLMLFFVWEPLFESVVMSLYKTRNIELVNFIGFKNYISVMGKDDFLQALTNTFSYTFWSLLLGFFLPMVLALLIGETVRSKSFFRTVAYLPNMLPGLAVVILWSAFFSGEKSGVLNILLNLFFVIVCKLDVAGVALASTIAQCVSAGLILHALTKVSDCYALDFRKVRLDLNMTKRILMLGVPAGLQNAIFAIANLFIQAGVNSFDSLMVKGNSAAANADAMIYDAMAAFYMACASFMSQNYGAGKLDRVKKSYFIALAYSFGLGAVLGGGLLVFGRQFLALFTTESAVVDAGMKRIMVMGWAYCTSAFMDCTIAASRGLGKTVGPTVHRS